MVDGDPRRIGSPQGSPGDDDREPSDRRLPSNKGGLVRVPDAGLDAGLFSILGDVLNRERNTTPSQSLNDVEGADHRIDHREGNCAKGEQSD